METKQLVQASAKVIRITEIKTGDVYKRFDKDYDDRTFYGVVKAVHNDGENAIIEATEYRKTWSDLDINFKVLKGEKDYILFPSSPEELSLEFESVKKSKEREIESSKESISKNEKLIKEIDGLMSGETQKNLSAMNYKELTQNSYNEKKALI